MEKQAAEAIAKEEAEFLSQAAEKIIFELKEKQLAPMIMVEYATGQSEMYDLRMLNSKNAWAALHQALAMKPGCKCAALVTEAWHARKKATKKVEQMMERVDRGEINLGDVPGSVEIVLINLIVGEHQFLARYPIDRKRRRLGESEMAYVGDGGWSGRMVRGPNIRKGH